MVTPVTTNSGKGSIPSHHPSQSEILPSHTGTSCNTKNEENSDSVDYSKLADEIIRKYEGKPIENIWCDLERDLEGFPQNICELITSELST